MTDANDSSIVITLAEVQYDLYGDSMVKYTGSAEAGEYTIDILTQGCLPFSDNFILSANNTLFECYLTPEPME